MEVNARDHYQIFSPEQNRMAPEWIARALPWSGLGFMLGDFTASIDEGHDGLMMRLNDVSYDLFGIFMRDTEVS